ncbi:hypothetical protein XENOCAPTIV_022717, partial [Xenoophorus captivus]
VDCPNFVHVVQAVNSTHLYACGSYAYSPHQVVIDIERLSVVHQDGAKGRCPYNPFERSSVVIIGQFNRFYIHIKHLQTEQPQPLTLRDTLHQVFLKFHICLSPSADQFIRSQISFPCNHTRVSSSVITSCISEPTFVSSSLDPAGQKLYFFFTEAGKEFSFVNELQIPRVAQVCKCGLSNSSDSELLRVKTNYLTSQSVTPGKQIVSLEQKYSRLVVMRTQAANGKHYDILFLLTGCCVLSAHCVVLVLKGVLYVGSSEGVTAVPVTRCLIYRNCSQCILARDPLCGWSPTRRTCTGLDGSNED